MVKYKLSRKLNPQKKDEKGKWHAIPSIVNRLDTRTVCKTVTRNTTTAPTELESSFNLVCDGVPHELRQGNSVRLGTLGSLRLSFGSAGVDDPADFNVSLIKNVKVIFTPSQELLAAVKDGLTFENVGVVEDGFTYASVKDYQDYQVSLRTTGGGTTGGGTTGGGSTGGGSEGEDGDNPIG